MMRCLIVDSSLADSPPDMADVSPKAVDTSPKSAKYTSPKILHVLLNHKFKAVRLPEQSLGERITALNELLKKEGYSASNVTIASSKDLNLKIMCHEVNLDAPTLAVLLKYTLGSRKIKYEIDLGEIRLTPKS